MDLVSSLIESKYPNTEGICDFIIDGIKTQDIFLFIVKVL